MPYIIHVLLFFSSRVHDRGVDVMGRCGIYVKTVLVVVIYVKVFPNTFLLVGIFTSPSDGIIVWEIHAEPDIDSFW